MTAPRLSVLLRLGKYVRPYRSAVALLLVGQLVESVYDVATRYSFRLIIDQAILPGNHSLLAYYLAVLAGATLVYSVVSVGSDYLWAKFGFKILNDLRHDLFVQLQAKPVEFFRAARVGDLAARFTADAARIEDGVLYSVPMAASGVMQLAFSLALMARISATLSLLAAGALVLSMVLPRMVNSRALAAGYVLRSQEGQLAGHVQENIAAQSVIKAYGLQRKAADDFKRELDRLLAVGLRSYFFSFLSQRLPQLLFTLGYLAIFGFGATLVMAGRMSLGDLVAFQALFLGLSQSMNNLAWLIPSLIDASASLQRIVEVMDRPAEHTRRSGAFEFAPLSRAITFDNVGLRFGDESYCLRNLGFSLPKGGFTAVVGPTGAGKTSILNLLLRFHDPSEGRILFDGISIEEGSLASLRRQIGLVPQETILFRASLADNIRAGLLDATDADVRAAARAAGIHDFIRDLPEGYDTIYGANGRQFSGGERQRIALARALVREPSILILDEATSALDNASEASILASLLALRGRCTIIAVTHRLGLARAADRILVLTGGRVIEDGDHDRLSAAGGLYAELWRNGTGGA